MSKQSDVWILEYRDDKGYVRKKKFGSYKTAMSFSSSNNYVMIKIYKESTNKDEIK